MESEIVLAAGREKFKNQELKEYGVSEDYSTKVRNIRKALIPHLIKFRQQYTDRKVFLKYDKLVVGKDTYVYNEETQRISKQPSGGRA